jgi:hypothetical protein
VTTLQIPAHRILEELRTPWQRRADRARDSLLFQAAQFGERPGQMAGFAFGHLANAVENDSLDEVRAIAAGLSQGFHTPAPVRDHELVAP